MQKGLKLDAQLIYLEFDNLLMTGITYMSKTFSKGLWGRSFSMVSGMEEGYRIVPV